jgi:D-glycero-D-manno-heptose 1,7-bisphosphate phosphatase
VKKAIFLDRDGVINEKAPEGDYVTRWQDLHVLPGVAEAIAEMKRAGFEVIVITNQRCVAKGLLTIAELEELHRQMSDYLLQAGARIDAIYYCPHESEPVCRCRKPAPGMLMDAAGERGIELRTSWMIGDSCIDVEAGKNAGCKTVRIWTASGDERLCDSAASSPADVVASSLRDAVAKILARENVAGSSGTAGAARSSVSGTH